MVSKIGSSALFRGVPHFQVNQLSFRVFLFVQFLLLFVVLVFFCVVWRLLCDDLIVSGYGEVPVFEEGPEAWRLESSQILARARRWVRRNFPCVAGARRFGQGSARAIDVESIGEVLAGTRSKRSWGTRLERKGEGPCTHKGRVPQRWLEESPEFHEGVPNESCQDATMSFAVNLWTSWEISNPLRGFRCSRSGARSEPCGRGWRCWGGRSWRGSTSRSSWTSWQKAYGSTPNPKQTKKKESHQLSYQLLGNQTIQM